MSDQSVDKNVDYVPPGAVMKTIVSAFAPDTTATILVLPAHDTECWELEIYPGLLPTI